ncbi:CaiB/BaiF CoA transferase family protein [Pseudomonas psychrophila]|uniref:CaiB/BaiF CoA transferase family protein n=1 Tax=Pseudomonas psychrophila TaxID=122355 RepID=UPI0038078E15
MNKRPLQGLKVLDLTRFLAGPYCAMLLGDHGAEVLKIEPPGGGDPTRVQGPPFVDGEGLTFLATNRNKQSLVLDLKNESDLQLLKKLAEQADVLLENFRPGVLERFDLHYKAMAASNPRLIYASISGFGQEGPMAHQGAFDLTIQALGGYMSITGERDGAPVKLGTSAIDMLAGMNMFSGILVALLERGVSGQGQQVETSLLESQVAFLSNAAFEHFTDSGLPQRWGSEHPQLVPYKAFRTSDAWIVIGAGVQNLFVKLLDALERKDLLEDERFASLPARLANRDVVNAGIEEITQASTTAYLLELLTRAGVPCAPVASVPEVFSNPQVLHREMRVEMEHEVPERRVTLGSAIKYSSFKITDGWFAPPRLNEGGMTLAKRWLTSHEAGEVQ